MDYRFLHVKHETNKSNAIKNIIGCVPEAAFGPEKIINITLLKTISKNFVFQKSEILMDLIEDSFI